MAFCLNQKYEFNERYHLLRFSYSRIFTYCLDGLLIVYG